MCSLRNYDIHTFELVEKISLTFRWGKRRLTQWCGLELHLSLAGLLGYISQYKQLCTCRHLQLLLYQEGWDWRNTVTVWYHSLHTIPWIFPHYVGLFESIHFIQNWHMALLSLMIADSSRMSIPGVSWRQTHSSFPNLARHIRILFFLFPFRHNLLHWWHIQSWHRSIASSFLSVTSQNFDESGDPWWCG